MRYYIDFSRDIVGEGSAEGSSERYRYEVWDAESGETVYTHVSYDQWQARRAVADAVVSLTRKSLADDEAKVKRQSGEWRW